MKSSEVKKIFKKYMVVKDPDKAHAVLSASGSERWLGCPGSIRLSDGIPGVDTEWSIAGTNAHTLLQFILENYSRYGALLNHPDSKAFKKLIDFSDDQLRCVMVAVEYVLRTKKRASQDGNIPITHVEKKVELEGVGFGTADVILYQPFGTLHVMDYKNGQSVVEPEENSQGLYYAVAAADLYGWNFSDVWITIIQPNANHKKGPVRTWRTTPERLEKAATTFRRGAKITKDPNAPLVTDAKWCWFCPARQICPKQMEVKEKNIMTKFSKVPRNHKT